MTTPRTGCDSSQVQAKGRNAHGRGLTTIWACSKGRNAGDNCSFMQGFLRCVGEENTLYEVFESISENVASHDLNEATHGGTSHLWQTVWLSTNRKLSRRSDLFLPARSIARVGQKTYPGDRTKRVPAPYQPATQLDRTVTPRNASALFNNILGRLSLLEERLARPQTDNILVQSSSLEERLARETVTPLNSILRSLSSLEGKLQVLIDSLAAVPAIHDVGAVPQSTLPPTPARIQARIIFLVCLGLPADTFSLFVVLGSLSTLPNTKKGALFIPRLLGILGAPCCT